MIEHIAYIKDCNGVWIVDFKDIGVYATVQAKSLKEVLKKAKDILKESIYYFDINEVPVNCKISTTTNNKNLFLIQA